MERRRATVAIGTAAAISLFAISIGAPRVRDAVDRDVDVVLDEPGEYQQPLEGADGDVAALPAVEVRTVAGGVMSTGDLVGTPLVINLWFAACPPCVREMPEFAEVHAEFGDRVRFIGVNPIDEVDRMLEFAESVGVSYELYLDPFGRFTDALETASFPLTVFVDADGRILARDGVLDADGLRERIALHFRIPTSRSA
ncbi:MAG: TlpA family protein disulfide reductase [Ilumatobacteraceae bacterium]